MPSAASLCTDRSHVHVEGPHEQVQVPDAGGVEEFGQVHEGQGDAQGRPDAAGHGLVTPVLPLLVQSRQEVTDRLPGGTGVFHY